MTRAAKTVYYFGFYLIVMGATITIVPNVILALFQFPETNEVWIRIVGVLVFDIGLFYVFTAPTNNTTFFRMTVYNRFMILGFFLVFVLLGWVGPMLLLFGVVDAAGAIWTLMALKES